MGSVVGEIVTILGSGIQGLGTSIAAGVQNMITALFLSGSGTTESPYKLSTTGAVICVFGGVALAISLTTKIYNWVMSLGAR